MSIIRHEIRQISDENRGQPIISQAVVHGNVAYFAGITPNPIVGDIKTQTAQVLRRVDELLNLAGTDKSQLLSAQVWIADMRLFEDHNSVWNEWISSSSTRQRANVVNDPARDQRRAGSLVRCSAAPLLLHDDRRADLDPVIEIDHVLIGHANAAR